MQMHYTGLERETPMPRQNSAEVLVDESTLTSRGQTTIPAPIRKALRLGPADKLRFSLRADNTVVLSRSPEATSLDPVIGAFLDFIERDASARPERIGMIPDDLMARARDLTAGVDVDLGAPLDPEDE